MVQVERGTASPTQPSLISIDIDNMENVRPFCCVIFTSGDVDDMENGRPFVDIIFVGKPYWGVLQIHQIVVMHTAEHELCFDRGAKQHMINSRVCFAPRSAARNAA